MPQGQRFRTGELIPYSGLYRVHHASHRLPHEVTLLDGEAFPRCLKCDTAVEFELVHEAPNIRSERGFRVVLFGLPEVDGEPNAVKHVARAATEQDVSHNQVLQPDAASPAEEQQGEKTFLQWRSLMVRRRSGTKEKNSDPRVFKPGEEIPEDGLYSVEHDSHRLIHQATLAKEALFPSCRTCGAAVRFRLVHPVERGSVLSLSASSILEDFEEPNPPSAKAG